MNPIKHCWDRIGRNVNKWNDVATFDDLARALVDEWSNFEPQFLQKLVLGMPRRVRELQQRRGYTRHCHGFLKWRWAGQHSFLWIIYRRHQNWNVFIAYKCLLNKNVEFCKFKLKLLFFFKRYSFGWNCTSVLILPLLYKIQWHLV